MNRFNRYSLTRLRQAIRPLRLHWFPRVGSTNTLAAQMRRRRNLYAPALVLAGAQVAGRGRGDNTWWSCEGSITATLVVPIRAQLLPHQLALVAGLALRNAVAEITEKSSIELKWPNDLLYRGRKLAGVLCERVRGVDLIGIGLNVNIPAPRVPEPLGRRIISLSEIAQKDLDKTTVLAGIVKHVYSMLSRGEGYPFPAMLREYDRHHALRGRRVSVLVNRDLRPVRGTCTGLDELGRLRVRNHRAQELRIIAGSVQMR